MPLYFWDPTLLLLIPVILLAVWSQAKIKSTYAKYSKILSARGTTGADTAKFILQHNGLSDVKIEAVEGKLSDHYDPRSKTVRLSSDNYKGRSLSAIAVSAHEVGHAIQHGTGYMPLKIRHSILPATNLGSWAAFPLFIIGFLFNTPFLMDIGIILFTGVVIFHLVTLPVEFNASQRALAQLNTNGLLIADEVKGARKVLNAAAMTYVAATAVALIHLVRLLILRGNE